jgi:ankyrin repeat protein
VKRGANIHQADDEGVTPLQMAALKGHQEVVDYLMSKGATFEATGTLAKVCKCCGAAQVWSLLDCLLLLQGMSGEGVEGGG